MPTPRPKPKPTTRKEASDLALTRERLQRLCGFLQALPPDRFDYGRWVSKGTVGPPLGPNPGHPCGTVCCAAGWLPEVDPKAWGWTTATGAWLHCPIRLYRRGTAHSRIDASYLLRALSSYFPAMPPDEVQMVFTAAGKLFKGAGTLCEPVTPRHLVRVIQYWLSKGRLPRCRALAW